MATSRARQIMRENMYKNNIALSNWVTQIKLIATTMFEWEELPEGLPSRFIENSLYYHGLLAMYDDPALGILIAKATPSITLNLYEEHTHYQLDSVNGYHQLVKAKDIVLLRNNIDEIPTVQLVSRFAERLYNIDRAMDTNIELQKYSALIKCSEGQRSTYENMLMQYEGNIPFIFGTKEIDSTAIEILGVDVPYLADKFQEHKMNVWTELMSSLGINNANTNKKERLLVGEVNSNNDYLGLVTDIYLSTREDFCVKANEKFGLNISVKRRCKNGALYDVDNGGNSE